MLNIATNDINRMNIDFQKKDDNNLSLAVQRQELVITTPNVASRQESVTDDK